MLSLFFILSIKDISVQVKPNAVSGDGRTTRYWDCCKPSCGWDGKATVSAPVASCDKNGAKLATSTKSGCDGGTAYMCSNQVPRAVNSSFAYGFAAASISGYQEAQSCCTCILLTFKDTAASGQKLLVQVTNTGGDLGSNQFDLAIPGGGLGIFTDGCPAEFGSWNGGSQYGGVSSASQCSQLPSALQSGCQFRFDWLKGADNPSVSFTEVTCPSELTSITGCTRR
uniref:Cellulase n=1 Tax=uncultured symbiotic protist of Cryptocercus punctulatus TaxID=403662 RepID=A4UX69_9EUKA|nr:putative glycosyl hydrolase family45 [uncultured symbiotic protist of Cryptocercus punctulatus]